MFRQTESYDLNPLRSNDNETIESSSSPNNQSSNVSVATSHPLALSYVNFSFSPNDQDEIDLIVPTSKPNDQTYNNASHSSKQIFTEVHWKNLDVFVNDRRGPKQILKSINGYVNNTQMLAILGPSGAGKSTLLNTIAGINRNYNGEITFKSQHKSLAFSYVPQTDELSAYLTVKETLLLTSRLKNPPSTNHQHAVAKLMEDFSLIRCADHLASKCSGGERKRLSIGCEMISKPDVLILDEPTSGLDSTTSLKVMQTVKQSNHGTAIIATIHQPNSTLFQTFDKVYFLTGGRCIYFGSPNQMVPHLNQLNVHVPTYTNPSDFMLDVANDDRSFEGAQLITLLSANYLPKAIESESTNELNNDRIVDSNENVINTLSLCSSCAKPLQNGDGVSNGNNFFKSLKMNLSLKPNKSCNTLTSCKNSRNNVNGGELLPVSRSNMRQMAPFYRTYPLLLFKLFLCSYRDPQQSVFRLLNNMLLPIILHLLTTGEHGKETGCSFLFENSTHVHDENIFQRMDRQEIGTQNAGLTFLDLMFAFFSTLVPAVLSISGHINVLRKEHLNSYYSLSAFFLALLTVANICTIFFSTVNAFAYFFFTGQTYLPYKLAYFWAIIVITSLLGDMLGLVLSILFPRKSLTALVIGGFFGFGLHTFSGFFVPTSKMAAWFREVTWFVFCRHTFEGIVKTFYGHGQCVVNASMIYSFDQLLDFVDYYNHETHDNLQIIQKMPIKVRTALEEKPWNKSAIFDLAEAVNDLDQEGLDKLEYFWNFKTSYILDSYDIPQTSIESNFIVPLITWLLLIFLCVFLLKLKLKK